METRSLRDFLRIGLVLLMGSAITLFSYLKVMPSHPLYITSLVLFAGLMIVTFIGAKNIIPRSTTQGSAHWAEPQEIPELLTPKEKPLAPGALMLGWQPTPDNISMEVGTHRVIRDIHPKDIVRQKRLDLPKDLKNRHFLMLGTTGAGKSAGFYLPQCLFFNGSFLYTDPKSEAWALTSGYKKYPARFAPTDPTNSHPFNFLPLCTDSILCFLLAKTITINYYEEGDRPNPFYSNAGAAFIAAVFAHATTFKYPTPAAAYDFLMSFDASTMLTAMLDSKSRVARAYATILLGGKEETLLEIQRNARLALGWLAIPAVRKFTSCTEYPPNFGVMKQKQISVYYCLSETETKVLKSLSAIFFTVILHQLKYAKGKESIVLLLDEFGNLGNIPAFVNEITLLRGRDIGVALALQDLNQLETLYGKAQGSIILGNLNTKGILNGLDLAAGKYVSDLLGKTTVSEEKITETTSGNFLSKQTTISKQISKTTRPLLFPDEVRQIGDLEQIIVTKNYPPVKCDRIFFDYPGKRAQDVPLLDELPVDFGSVIDPSQFTKSSGKESGKNSKKSKNKPVKAPDIFANNTHSQYKAMGSENDIDINNFVDEAD